ncbi:hypothetical protein J2Z22_004382 [Paenibacillus forsythiae]|uniref:Transposase n=1 Tax=Paenibacillus forsythiae TaxID=365616 RepID=A0ABU3HD98_9BACL|nr:hypothetical protein [Paenibacillus forsythiae]MDT3428789.1 hypothetical protein [Paenibacillus forsythiae]
MEPTTKGATYYQYKLLKKISIPVNALRIYAAIPVLFVLLETVFVSPASLLFFLIAVPVIFWIQYVVSRSVLLIAGYPIAKRWRNSFRLPWLGYMPDQYISCGLFRRVQLHSLWIGLAFAALFAVLSPHAFTLSLAFLHLWLLFPRFYALLRAGWKRQDDMLKFNPADVSCYSQ